MKKNAGWSFVIAATLCLGLCMSGCQQSSETADTLKAENAPVSPTPYETPVQKATPTLTPVPVPVQRKDVRITGLMIGPGVDAHNKIIKPTSKYRSGDSIFALVRTNGHGPEATIKLRCKDSADNIVFEESKKIMPKGEDAIVFTLTAAKNFNPGEYHLMGLLDDYPGMAVGIEVSERK